MEVKGSSIWYVAFAVVILGATFLYYKKSKLGVLIMYTLLFFSMFRGDNVGNDTKGYMDPEAISYNATLFSRGLTGEDLLESLGKQTEVSNNLLNYIVYNLELPPRVIIYTFSIITILFFFFALKRLRINTSLGQAFFVLSGLYYFSLTAARQMAAVSIFIYGLTFLFSNDKKKYLFFLYTIIAATFHASAIFFIWVYAVRRIRLSRSSVLLIMCAFALLAIVTNFDVTDYLYRIFNVEYVMRYMGMFDESGRSLLGRLNDIVTYGFMIYVLYMRVNKESDLYDNLYVIAFILMALFGHADMLIGRVTFFLTIFSSIYMAKTIIDGNCFKKSPFIVFMLLFVLFKVYGLRTWATALTSGYYLMF